MYIKPLSPHLSMCGQMQIDDLVIFSDTGRFASIHRMWTALTKYALEGSILKDFADTN